MSGPCKGGARAVVAVALLALLAACAQYGPRSASNSPYYNRPDSTAPPGPPEDPWGPWIRDASRRFDVPERWIREVMRQESGGRPYATSPAGAMGLMQVMPSTYREMQARYGLGPDPYHPYDNIQAGAAYMREMYELYGSPAFLAAYNAGPRRLEDYLWGGRPLPDETRTYVARIAPRIAGTHPNRRVAPEVYAAAEIGHYIPPGPRPLGRATMLAQREQREAATRVEVAAAPPPPAAPAQPAAPAHMQGIENPTLTASARAALAEAARQSEIERSRQQAEQNRAGRVAVATLAPPERQAPAASPFSRLGLIGTAQASTLPPPPTPPATAAARPAVARTPQGGANWSVQVGAFASQNLARTAANQARDRVALLGTRSLVVPVQHGRTTLYRARVTGLTRSGAEQACARLRSLGDCTIIAPGA